jgi:phosphomannomutase
MPAFNWKNLQNGSDVRGVALSGTDEIANLTPERVYYIAKAFCQWLENLYGKVDLQISLGRDSRVTGEELVQAFASGVIDSGHEPVHFGIASTPAMYMSTVTKGFDFQGAVMLTASHLPYDRNGIKFFTKDGGLNKNDISDILERASMQSGRLKGKPENVLYVNFMSEYTHHLVQYIRDHSFQDDSMPLKGMKIIVDAGNGAGGFFVHDVLQCLGAETQGSQFLDPDGYFPNHSPNPEDGAAIKHLITAVLKNEADLGIIFDTDVDRAALVDNNGRPIYRNALIALISSIVLEEHPGSTIVTDSITSEGLTNFIEKHLGGKHFRYKRGYKNVINEAVKLNHNNTECHLAIETSGHGALKENYFLDDGAFLMAKVLARTAVLHREDKDISYLIDELEEPLEAQEFRFGIQMDDFKEYGQEVIGELQKYVAGVEGWQIARDNYEGIRVSCNKNSGDGWFLLRLSLHDPVLPLNIESNSAGGVKKMGGMLYDFLSAFHKLNDTDKLIK